MYAYYLGIDVTAQITRRSVNKPGMLLLYLLAVLMYVVVANNRQTATPHSRKYLKRAWWPPIHGSHRPRRRWLEMSMWPARYDINQSRRVRHLY